MAMRLFLAWETKSILAVLVLSETEPCIKKNYLFDLENNKS